MLTDGQLKDLTLPIVDIYNKIELGLIEAVARRFDVYDKVGGSLEWQARKLDELGALNADAVKLISKLSSKSEQEILQMLNDASIGNIDMADLTSAFNAGLVFVDPVKLMKSPVMQDVIDLSYKELGQTFKMIQTKALESTKQAYMDVINKAYVEVASGVYDYNTSIRNALRDMADRGITGATYRQGRKLVRYSIESVVRRDTITAVHKLANKGAEKACNEIGAEYVEVSEHLGARVSDTDPIADHAGWQGKVYKLKGSDKQYPNLEASTGYPSDILGLGGVNCRHRMFPFWPGISTPNKHKVDTEENRRVYEASQKQRAMERSIRATKKRMIAAKASGDTEEAKKYRKILTEKQRQINKFCEDNGLRRQTEREMVQEEY